MIAAIDIETTGTDYWRSEIIALSVGLYGDDGQLNAEKELFFKPVRLKFWDKNSEAVHKISLDRALTFPDPNESWQEFFDFLNDNTTGKVKFLCHALYLGSYFDEAFIRCQMFLTDHHWLVYKYFSETISTHTMCQKLKTGGIYNFEKLSLDYLCNYFSIPIKHHDARSDRQACAKLYFKIRDAYYAITDEEVSRKEASWQASQNQENSPHRAIHSKVDRRKKRQFTEMG
jgi:DNA polymerase III epsilon subunit-like protein